MQILPEVHLVAASRGTNILEHIIQLMNSTEAKVMFSQLLQLTIPTKVLS